MEVLSDPDVYQNKCLHKRCQGQVLALVPTMGYYHEGHLALMRWARQNCDFLAVSLFVNPAQFGPGEDFESYPRDFERDRSMAEEEGVDLLFVPEPQYMYSSQHSTWVEVPELSKGLCGKSRPTHFTGVCTVVSKLLNLSLPHLAVFGRKDWQQLAIIERMARDLNFPVEIVGRPIVREKDGLAMSSRNLYLTGQERKEAAHIYRGLQEAAFWVQEGQRSANIILSGLENFYINHIPSGQIDYLEIVDPHQLTAMDWINDKALLAVAIKLGKARLIDNILLEG